ncbi:MAG: hypothetical protein A2X61_05590 [Ignavibacteria bacterium GWB2_35_12]|nr:MAG: hypothetical protein A2X61_05590 [Ignavibacteria bacterium GWB2_35_12]OGU94829.1 MAG: hypothetical protein A2220_13885 [Ignavibacteria bacterium RIFOXYA2_FULL_35_10]OGV19973.1 MAG: hypothetical protein A2475_00160 [Ignavibacteria bacterium RIFOXYC2_FULL_35_21]
MNEIIIIVAFLFGLIIGGIIIWFKQKSKIDVLNLELTKDKDIYEEKIQTLLKAEDNFKDAFEILANNILKKKSEEFETTGITNIEHILTPFKGKIDLLNTLIDSKFNEEAKDVASLKTQISLLIEQAREISKDANYLANALTGDGQKIGRWGEDQLEKLFENMGLKVDIHYLKQAHFKDEEDKTLIPDYIIKLPDGKCLIIDSKVSISAYENYYETDDEMEKQKYLKEHIKSIENHIKELAQKEYHKLYQINQPDYVLMYIPIEPAFLLALNEDKNLYERAYKNDIILVSTSILLATLRTIKFIWTQENQKQNVLEIARIGGALYDKFVDFISDMEKINDNINNISKSYHSAMSKLKDSPQKGSTIIGRIEQLKELGARTTKSIPSKYIGDNTSIVDDQNGEQELAKV